MTGSDVVLVGIAPVVHDEVLATAVGLARDLGCRLVCVHVDAGRYEVRGVDGVMHTPPIDPDLPELDDDEGDPAVAAALQRALGHTQLDWSLRELVGDPAYALAALADELDARMIVVGSREPGLRAEIREFFGGSVAARLVHRQHRPVVVVPLGPVTDGGPLPWE